MVNHLRRRNAMKTSADTRRALRALLVGRNKQRRLTADEKVKYLQEVIADIEAQGKAAGFIRPDKEANKKD